MLYYVFNAAARAMQPLLSTYNGEGNEKELRRTGAFGLLAGMLTGGVVIVFIAAFPQITSALFGLQNGDVVPLAGRALRIYCFSAVFAGFSTLLENFYQSCSADRNAFTLATLRGLVILLMTGLFGLLGSRYIWYIYPANELLSLAVFSLWRRFKGEDLRIKNIRKFEYSIEDSSKEIAGLSEMVVNACEAWDVSPKRCIFSGMAAEEICLAIREHNRDSQNGTVFIQVTVICRPDDSIELHMRDNGLSFNPFDLNGGKVGEEDFDEAAMGMIVIKRQAQEFLYRKYQGFNTIVVKV